MARGPTPTPGSNAPNAADYPAAHDTPNLPDRRLLWLVRIFAFTTGLLGCAVLMLAAVIFGMQPLEKNTPFLVQLQSDKHVLSTITPVENTAQIPGWSLVTENLVREYVSYRNEIVRSDAIMEQRWLQNGVISQMSSEAEYTRFIKQVTPIFEQIRQSDVTQEVKILAVSALRENSLYTVEFDTVGRAADNRALDPARWVATLEVAYTTRKDVPLDALRVNPTGFTVVNYTLAQKAG